MPKKLAKLFVVLLGGVLALVVFELAAYFIFSVVLGIRGELAGSIGVLTFLAWLSIFVTTTVHVWKGIWWH
ncbi:hypothetical protein ACM78Z_26680 [Pseudomonas aeruginosa]